MHLIRNKCNRKLLMKISALALLLTWFAAAIAAPSAAQNLASVHAKLPPGTMTLRDALKQIEQQTDIRFSYVSADINMYTQAHVNRRSSDLATLLDDLLDETELVYRQVGKTVVIKKKTTGQEVLSPPNQALQERQGRVLDERGRPLAGVSVRVKGSSRGTSTDQDGYFSIREEG